MAAVVPASWSIDAERLVQAPDGVPAGACLMLADYRVGRHVVEDGRESWWWVSDYGQGLLVEYHEKLPRRVAAVSGCRGGGWGGGHVLRAACWRARPSGACSGDVLRMHVGRGHACMLVHRCVQAHQLGVAVAYLYPGPNWSKAVISRETAAALEPLVADVDKPVVVRVGPGREEVGACGVACTGVSARARVLGAWRAACACRTACACTAMCVWQGVDGVACACGRAGWRARLDAWQ